ncbi:MAG: transposase [bacterium]|nr:transposase [bacterium]
MQSILSLIVLIVRCSTALLRTRGEQAIVELTLRQQLATYAHNRRRPRLRPLDRAFWVALSRLWPRWRSALVIVKPETVVRWHREGFRRHWTLISKPGPGRPPISKEVQQLIVRMAAESPWRARKIQAELLKLGIRLSLATVSRYLPARPPDPDAQQRWKTFLRNHKEVVAGMDFFVVPTVRFRLLYVWFVLDHGRRRVLHFNVTEHPTAGWVIQQLRVTFPGEASHRFLIHDNDAIFSAAVAKAVANLGVSPRRTAFCSPWQNGTAERFVGTVRRELLDHVVVLGEDHLRRLLRDYVDFFERDRVHTVLRDSPLGRPVERRPSLRARVVGSPRVGGIHQRYAWSQAS